jgi:hypothetical protein
LLNEAIKPIVNGITTTLLQGKIMLKITMTVYTDELMKWSLGALGVATAGMAICLILISQYQ